MDVDRRARCKNGSVLIKNNVLPTTAASDAAKAALTAPIRFGGRNRTGRGPNWCCPVLDRQILTWSTAKTGSMTVAAHGHQGNYYLIYKSLI